MPTITKGTNVEIPAKNAGIGDIVLLDSSRNIKVIGHGTYDATSLPAGYVTYGVIYGFVNGLARIVALEDVNRRFAMLASDTGDESVTGADSINAAYQLASSQVGTNKNTIRNGNTTTYAMISLNVAKSYNWTGDNTIIHPTAAAPAEKVMSRANFEALPLGGGNARDLYGTYENYLSQCLAVCNPGSYFMATDGDRKPHEQGRWNTILIGAYTKANPDPNAQGTGPCWYPAANYCYNYFVSGAGEAAADHNWWLPSMNEMFDLMIDEHLLKVNTSGATTISDNSGRYSSIRSNNANVCCFRSASGISYSYNMRYAYRVRPVTILKLD